MVALVQVQDRLRESLRLFNTMGMALQPFAPVDERTVKLYYCGPTVYNEAHIGNMRAYLFSDALRRTLDLAGYDVDAAMNITDVGHLTSDADDGDDKMLVAAAAQKTTAWEIARKYTDLFLHDTDLLNITRPAKILKATDYIQQQIDLVSRLEAKGVTYSTDDGLYFDTTKIDDYGKLTPNDARDEVLGGARVDLGGKRNATDFALWKVSPADDTKRDMEWESPWGVGFPGWHIECSAMAMDQLGDTLDIHIGGTDHVPIHHTNEIAQSETATGVPFAHWWMHCAFLTLDANKKMSKSDGTFLTVRGLEEQGYHPHDFRYLALTSHYRSQLSFSLDNLAAAATARSRLLRQIDTLLTNAGPRTDDAAAELAGDDVHLDAFIAGLADDLNTPRAVAAMWGLVRESERPANEKLALLEVMDRVLGLDLLAERSEDSSDVPAEIVALAEERVIAKQAKDFARSDELRDEAAAAGFVITDTAEGYTISPA